MELIVERAAALDVGKDEVVACIRVPDPAGAGRGRGRRRQEVRTYPTFTSSLEALADWLQAEGITQVVMEATGQYWKPCWYVLEERGLALLLVNARHVKILPGRKTDVGDAAWLADSTPATGQPGGPPADTPTATTHGYRRAQFDRWAAIPMAMRCTNHLRRRDTGGHQG